MATANATLPRCHTTVRSSSMLFVFDDAERRELARRVGSCRKALLSLSLRYGALTLSVNRRTVNPVSARIFISLSLTISKEREENWGK